MIIIYTNYFDQLYFLFLMSLVGLDLGLRATAGW